MVMHIFFHSFFLGGGGGGAVNKLHYGLHKNGE